MRRPLLLNGFMGSGKSSIGPRVALRLSRPFIDLDQHIEAHVGLPVAEIFKQRGEAEFRRIEGERLRALIAGAAADSAPVIALGGGALMRRETRLLALDQTVVVTLQASFAEISRRVGNDPRRPVFAGDPEALLELRQRAYAEAHARVRTDGRSMDAIADEVVKIWERDALAVAVGEQSYSVEIGRGLLGRLPALVGSASRVVLVTDQNVFPLHGARVSAAFGPDASPTVVQLIPGEEHKHIGSIESIWRASLAASADRSSVFVSLGGGVASDMTGFAAATYMRGVPWVCVPTTLLAMVDASVGGKTGVDLGAKNAVGAFHQPKAVLCDVDLLATESLRGFRSALAEVVKTALIGDGELLDRLESNAAQLAERDPALLVEIVRRSIRVKARIVSEDERESGPRAKLNLGHTIGHALEAQAGYSRLSHGEAISLGLVAALRIGVRLGVTPPALADRVQTLLERIGLPTDVRAEPLAEAVQLIGHDKKRAGKKLRFVVARAPDQVETMDIELERVKELALTLAQPA